MEKEITILVVSDDHGLPGFEKAYNQAEMAYEKIDYVIHAGDTQGYDETYYSNIARCPIYIVKGNNDYNDEPKERIIEIGGKRIFVTHGHAYGVYLGVQNLAYRAKEKEADIAIFGHTHHAFYAKAKELEIINPGSLALPRGSRNGSYAIITIKNGEVIVEHFSIN